MQLNKGLNRSLKRFYTRGFFSWKSSGVKMNWIRLCGNEKDNRSRGRRRSVVLQLFLATLFFCMLTWTTILYYSSNGAVLRIIRPVRIQLPQPSSSDEMEEEGSGKKLKLKYLSMELTSEIGRLSNPTSCENMSTLYCGHFDDCGLGCQLHHRAACLMLSYSMGIPLIHDTTAWPFGEWEDSFQPLGSHCPSNERTITVKWAHNKMPVLSFNKLFGDTVQYPFQSGIPVDPDFLQAIQDNHPDPFLWYVGQFLKYTMRLSFKVAPVVQDFLRQLPTNTPLVGLQVRRTDKINEARDSYHEIQDYLVPADAYFQRVHYNLNRTLYLASDDHTLLTQAQKLYPLPKWRFIGLKINETFHNQKSRLNSRALISIIQDVLALTKCDYVVCGFSSNVCRLLLELISADHRDGFDRVKSLDQYYLYTLAGHSIPKRLIPVSPADLTPS